MVRTSNEKREISILNVNNQQVSLEKFILSPLS